MSRSRKRCGSRPPGRHREGKRRLLPTWLTLTAVLAAQPTIEWWPGSWEAAFDEARARNVPVLIGFVMDGEEANDRIVAGLYQDAAFVKLTDRLVPIVVSMGMHASTKQEVRGQTISVCSRFGGIPCTQHKELEAKARNTYWKGTVQTPSHVMVLPDGVEVERLIDVHGTSAFEDLLKQARRKLGGGGLDAPTWRGASRRLRLAELALDKGELDEAIEGLRAFEEQVGKSPALDVAARLRKRLHNRIADLIADAQEQVEAGHLVDALRILVEGAETFAGIDGASDLRREAARIRQSKEGRAAARILDKEEKGRPFWKQGQAAEKAGEWVAAIEAYEEAIAKAKETPLAEKADARIRALREDPDIGPLVREAMAAKVGAARIRSARIALRRGQRDRARELLESVIEEFPDTPVAKEAKALLEKGP